MARAPSSSGCPSWRPTPAATKRDSSWWASSGTQADRRSTALLGGSPAIAGHHLRVCGAAGWSGSTATDRVSGDGPGRARYGARRPPSGRSGCLDLGALTAATPCVTPLLGGLLVNGELLSAPFVVGGLAAVLAAIELRGERRAAVAAWSGGAAAMAALLVKQNMGDVAVFGAVVLVMGWRARRADHAAAGQLRSSLRLWSPWPACWQWLPGPWPTAHRWAVSSRRCTPSASKQDVYWPRRTERVPTHRLWALLAGWGALSGGAVIMGMVAQALAQRRLRSTAVWGLTATLIFDIASIALGGSYWHHYLVQMVVPIAVLSGLLVANGHSRSRTMLTAVGLAAAVAVGVSLADTHRTAGTSVGRAISDVSTPTTPSSRPGATQTSPVHPA